MLTYILFPLGFVVLIKGADLLVEGASSVASKFGVSQLVIGLTIVSFGTSAPEFVVNIMASFDGSAGLAYGNIVGSNIANTLLILGVATLIYPTVVQSMTVYREIPMCLLASLVLSLMVNDVLINGDAKAILSRIDGLLLLAFFSIFLFYVYNMAKKGRETANEGGEESLEDMSSLKAVIYILIGSAGLMFGGEWIVDGAVEIARLFDLSETLIGLTIVAIGTSLPELAASAMAAYKKNNDIAIGNVVGSNIFNIFWVLGASSTIRPLLIEDTSPLNLGFMIGSALFLFLFLFVGKRHVLERWQGGVFVTAYAAYIAILVVGHQG